MNAEDALHELATGFAVLHQVALSRYIANDGLIFLAIRYRLRLLRRIPKNQLTEQAWI